MTSKLRSVAESRFAALTRRENLAMSDIEAERQATREKTERLRAQRFAHEAATVAEQVAHLNKRRGATLT